MKIKFIPHAEHKIFEKCKLKETVNVISSECDPICKDVIARFAMVPWNALSDQAYTRYL